MQNPFVMRVRIIRVWQTFFFVFLKANVIELVQSDDSYLVMDNDLYDEFGNYIGPEIESDDSGVEESEEEVI